jgi:hypothetical protein
MTRLRFVRAIVIAAIALVLGGASLIVVNNRSTVVDATPTGYLH